MARDWRRGQTRLRAWLDAGVKSRALRALCLPRRVPVATCGGRTGPGFRDPAPPVPGAAHRQAAQRLGFGHLANDSHGGKQNSVAGVRIGLGLSQKAKAQKREAGECGKKGKNKSGHRGPCGEHRAPEGKWFNGQRGVLPEGGVAPLRLVVWLPMPRLSPHPIGGSWCEHEREGGVVGLRQ